MYKFALIFAVLCVTEFVARLVCCPQWLLQLHLAKVWLCVLVQASSHHGFWLPDMTVPCWSNWHTLRAAPLGSLLLFFCIIVPSLPAMLLYKYRSQLRAGNPDPDVRSRLGFIYQPYQ